MWNDEMHPAVVLRMRFVSWPTKAMKVDDSIAIRHSFSSFNASWWICLGNWWWSCQAHLILSSYAQHPSPAFRTATVPHFEDSSLHSFSCLSEALGETMIRQFLGINIPLFKSYYRGGLIAAGGNIPGETNHSSWHHQTDFPKGSRGIPHPFCPAAFQRLQHCGHA